jgi:hypothetical protein
MFFSDFFNEANFKRVTSYVQENTKIIIIIIITPFSHSRVKRLIAS